LAPHRRPEEEIPTRLDVGIAAAGRVMPVGFYLSSPRLEQSGSPGQYSSEAVGLTSGIGTTDAGLRRLSFGRKKYS
jgi:hypothetical protein